MTERSQINAAVRRHLGPLGFWERVESPITPGLPDWHYFMRLREGWLEDKLVPETRRCPKKFTLDQLLWAKRYVSFGGLWHLLGLTPSRTWLLFDYPAADRWFHSGECAPVLAVRGAFPTGELMARLAPPLFV